MGDGNEENVKTLKDFLDKMPEVTYIDKDVGEKGNFKKSLTGYVNRLSDIIRSPDDFIKGEIDDLCKKFYFFSAERHRVREILFLYDFLEYGEDKRLIVDSKVAQKVLGDSINDSSLFREDDESYLIADVLNVKRSLSEDIRQKYFKNIVKKVVDLHVERSGGKITYWKEIKHPKVLIANLSNWKNSLAYNPNLYTLNKIYLDLEHNRHSFSLIKIIQEGSGEKPRERRYIEKYKETIAKKDYSLLPVLSESYGYPHLEEDIRGSYDQILSEVRDDRFSNEDSNNLGKIKSFRKLYGETGIFPSKEALEKIGRILLNKGSLRHFEFK